MKSFLKEFRDFIATGNMIELAVAVILGTAIGGAIKAFTDGILMQLVAAIIGKPDFSEIVWGLGDAKLQIGVFINALITLISTGLVLFMIIKGYNRFKRPPAGETPAPNQLELLTQIRDALVERKHDAG